MGGSTKLLLALLVLLGVGGAYNYQRNLAKEAKQLRPFQNYTDADLETLLAAYRADAEGLSKRYQGLSQGRPEVRGGGLIDQQVRQFERVQRRGEQVREMGAALSMREADIAQLEREVRLREQARDPFGLFLKRVATFD